MRPITKGADPPYTDKTTFTFGGDNRAPIMKLLGLLSATDVPIVNCLNLWLGKVKGLPIPNGGTVAEQTKAVNAIKNQVGNLYKLASVPLTQRLGPFCNFCESPLSGLLEVEHCVPKAQYPTFSIAWLNFVLACSPCNNKKGDDPERDVVQGWLHDADPTEQEYYNEIRNNHYVWPDLNAEAYDWLPTGLDSYDTDSGTWVAMRHQLAANLNNEVLTADIATRTVTARIYWDDGTYKDLSVRANLEFTTPRGNEMIGLCQLNNPGNLDSTYDRRLFNRTLAWFTCLRSLKHYSMAPDDPTRAIFWQQLLMTAAATGFYSVWLFLISYLSEPHASQFVIDTNVPNYFPGTNATNLP